MYTINAVTESFYRAADCHRLWSLTSVNQSILHECFLSSCSSSSNSSSSLTRDGSVWNGSVRLKMTDEIAQMDSARPYAYANLYLSRITDIRKLENLLDARWSTKMPPPGLQIYLRPRVTLTFDLLTLIVDRFMPLLHWSLTPVCIKISSFVFKISCSEVWERCASLRLYQLEGCVYI